MRMTIVGRVIFFGLLLCIANGTVHAAASPEVYGDTPSFEGIQISPDGQRAAHIKPINGQHAAIIQDLAGDAPCAFQTGKLKIRELIWAPDMRLLIRLSPSRGEINRYLSIDAHCKNPILLFDRDVSDDQSLIGWAHDGHRLLWSSLRRMPGGSYNTSSTDIFGWGHIRRRVEIALDVVAIDTTTGKQEPVEKGNERTIDWIADSSGILRLRIDEIRDDEYKVFTRLGDEAEWREVYNSQASAASARIIAFVAMGPKPDTAYVITRNNGDRRAAYEFNLRTATLGPLLHQDPKFDVDGYQVDAYSGEAVGVSYADDLQKIVYFEPALASLASKIRALLPGEQVNLVTWSRDRSSLIVRADGSANRTGAYYFADTQTGQISKLGARYPAIAEGDIATVRSFSYAARDGLVIPAYLTLPPRSAGKNLAMIVMPHGGPEARDTAEFDRWAQFLATLGYAVFQPQFRGSDGFGWTFRQAGRMQWGLKMQDDITDGVKTLLADGTADPARVYT